MPLELKGKIKNNHKGFPAFFSSIAPKKHFTPVSVRIQLISLASLLFLMLILTGYLLHITLYAQAELSERQANIIQELGQISDTTVAYRRVHRTYFDFLNKPENEIRQKTTTALRNLFEIVHEYETAAIREKMRTIEELLFSLQDLMLPVIENKDDTYALEKLGVQAIERLAQIDTILSTIDDDLRRLLSISAKKTREEAITLHKIPTAFILGGLLTLAFVLSVVICNFYIPISRITRAMEAASQDTPNAKNYVLDIRRNDEIGKATHALNHLFREVSTGIKKIQEKETELRGIGQYLQTIMNNMIDGIIIVDPSGSIVSFSPGAETILGYTQDEMIGRDISRLFPRDMPVRDEILNYIHDPDLTDPRRTPYEINLLHKNRWGIPVELLISTAIYKETLMNIMTLRDITIRKKMESYVSQTQRMETIGKMSGGIAHDFNNLLIVISGNLELIDRRLKDEPELQEMIKDALDAVQRGKDFTQRILAFSRKQVLKPQLLNINKKLNDVIDLIQRAVREDITIETKLGANLWPVYIDPAQFESTMLNLALNARDAIKGSEGRIQIETKNIDYVSRERSLYPHDMKSGKYVMISVKDNGAGIPAEIIDKVFDPFFTTKAPDKGTGLGLSMVYGFTRQSGGYLRIDSTVDEGTTVYLYFPKSRKEKDKKIAGDAKEKEDTLEEMKGRNESVLVVEDKPDVLKYLTKTLRELGYRVTAASNAPEALRMLKKRRKLDLLVTDVIMPGGMNGEELAEKVQEDFAEAKVLFISGYTSDALVEEGTLKSGVNLLTKPFTSVDLARQIRMLLEQKEK